MKSALAVCVAVLLLFPVGAFGDAASSKVSPSKVLITNSNVPNTNSNIASGTAKLNVQNPSVDSVQNPSVNSKIDVNSSPYTGLYIKVFTDKSVYAVDEKVRISALVSKGSSDLTDAKVTLDISSPDGEGQTVSMDRGYCVASNCKCECDGTDCNTPCACDPSVSCQYDASIKAKEEGGYELTAHASLDNERADASAKFLVSGLSDIENVKLGQKFDLELGDSAVVVDYNNMLLVLDNVRTYKCSEIESESETAKCTDSLPAAFLRVRQYSEYPTYVEETKSGSSNKIVPTETPSYANEVPVTVYKGETVTLFSGATLSFLDYDGSEAVFVVEREDGSDFVSVKVVPSTVNIGLGETAEYNMHIKDKHKVTTADSKSYTYEIRVYDLPFELTYDDSITLYAGEEIKVPLYVDTSAVGSTYYKANSTGKLSNTATVKRSTTATVNSKASASTVNNQKVISSSVSEATLSEKVAISPEYSGNGRAYRFVVKVYGEGSEASADAVLNVLYTPPVPDNELEIQLDQGWNLVTLPGDGSLDSGNCNVEEESYAAVYVSSEGRYMTFKEATELMGEAGLKEYLETHPFWVYSFKACTLAFSLQNSASFNDLSLESGWNFVPVTQDMVGNSLDLIGGECSFEKLYYWDSGSQAWDKLDTDEPFEKSMLYRGFVAKAESSCGFGWGAVMSPPQLPE